MEAILKFQLPEEQEDFSHAINGLSWALTVWKINQKLRDWLKHGHQFQSADEALEKVRDYLREVLEDKNLSLDMIS